MQRSLIAKILLIKGLKQMGLTSYLLSDLKLTEFKRPYFDSLIDFNISHSADYIICAITKTGKIGVDIEAIQNIPILSFEDQFSSKEWDSILQGENVLQSFYILWTQKEAFLKAIGTGLYLPLDKITISDNKIDWNNEEWFLHQIKIDDRYVSHLSTNILSPTIVVEKMNLNFEGDMKYIKF
nr:4'-phosphopantetheinyl transferase superfamily protein [Segetibacter koreensis]